MVWIMSPAVSFWAKNLKDFNYYNLVSFPFSFLYVGGVVMRCQS